MKRDGDDALNLPDVMVPPPPSAQLLDAVRSMKPVRTRHPRRAYGAILVGSIAFGSLSFLVIPLRRDLGWLPAWWLGALGALWAAAFVLLVGLAVLPRRGQVAPDGTRALRTTGIVAGLLLVATSFAYPWAPGHTILLDGAAFFRVGKNCAIFSLCATLGPLTLGALALRRVIAIGAWRIGAALGAAGGALGGLFLLVLCPYGGNLHTGIMHGGGVVLCALIGAVLGSFGLRRG